MRLHFSVSLLALSLLSACGGGTTTDAGPPDLGGGPDGSSIDATHPDTGTPDASAHCATDHDCDDGTYCNGAEACMPGASGADARGCVAAPGGPCLAGMTCDETSRMCMSTSCAGAAADADADGHRSTSCGGDDCNDADPDTYPGNAERCDAAGHDEDCDPATLGPDRDHDTFVSSTCCDTQPSGTLLCGTDCDDTRATVNPTATETCDGVDNNCDGTIDEGVQLSFYRDVDGDHYGDPTMTMMGCTAPLGYVLIGGDCNDGDASIHPAAVDVCDGIDNDCDGTADPGCMCTTGASRPCGTSDGMGGYLMVGPCHPGTQTCTSGAWATCMGNVDPASAESCNGIDDNCNGTTDEGVQLTFYRDMDGDGHGNAAMTMLGCTPPGGYVLIGDDCNDGSPAVHPGAGEICNGVDDNCDGRIDEGVTMVFYRDADGDGYGNPFMMTSACSAPVGYVANNMDCNDANNMVHPGTMDICDGVDDDCDGVIDAATCACTSGMSRMCGTSDGMGGFLMVAPCHPGSQTCTAGGMWPTCSGNVDPTAESCNGVDDNCNGTIDEGVQLTFYRDMDGDGHGLLSMSMRACTMPAGYVLSGDDCNDANAAVHPGAGEICNGVDDNCDGRIDEGVTTVFYRDMDIDGYGNPLVITHACSAPAGYVLNNMDCNDSNAMVHPGVIDTCDGIDDDCDGVVDAPTCTCTSGMTRACGTPDGMGGFLMVGVCHPGTQTCTSGGAWPACSGNVSPSTEVCNGLDDDCNGTVDNSLTFYYQDCDHDGFGAAGSTTAGCTVPGTPPACGGSPGVWVGNATDCNDTSAAVHPGAPEICNGADDDCNSVVDDSAPSNTYCNTPAELAALHASAASCITGQCHATTCVAPYLDCTTGPDGCETNGSNDPAHCMTCGHSCAAGFQCRASACYDTPVQVAAGDDHTCIRRASGAVVCWGSSYYGQVGTGLSGAGALMEAPMTVPGVTAVQIDCGLQETCARLASGGVSCWGRNGNGQIGDGTVTERHMPTAVSGLTDATQIDVGGWEVCAHRGTTHNDIVCWGENLDGEIGNNSTTDAHTPTQTFGYGTSAPPLTDTGVSVGGTDACAINTSLQVNCWGGNTYYQLGDGTMTDRHTPGLTGVSATSMLAAGSQSTCALSSSGVVNCWGSNGRGQLGNGAVGGHAGPTAVSFPMGAMGAVVEICAQNLTNCARLASGQVWCWGFDSDGQLGNGSPIGTDSSSPVQVSGLTDATQIACGGVHACALRATGDVVCWGANGSEQLADGTTMDRSVPTPIVALP